MVTKKNHNVRRKRFNKTRKRSTKYKKQLGRGYKKYNKKYNDISDENKYYVVYKDVEELLKKHLPNKNKEFMKLMELMKSENNDAKYMEFWNEAEGILNYSFTKENAETFLKEIFKIVCELPEEDRDKVLRQATKTTYKIAKKKLDALIDQNSCINYPPKSGVNTGYSRRRGYRRQVGGDQQQQIREGQELAGQALMNFVAVYIIACLYALICQILRNPPRDT